VEAAEESERQPEALAERRHLVQDRQSRAVALGDPAQARERVEEEAAAAQVPMVTARREVDQGRRAPVAVAARMEERREAMEPPQQAAPAGMVAEEPAAELPARALQRRDQAAEVVVRMEHQAARATAPKTMCGSRTRAERMEDLAVVAEAEADRLPAPTAATPVVPVAAVVAVAARSVSTRAATAPTAPQE